MKQHNLPQRQLVATDDPSLVRDTHSKALLNTDMKALEAYRERLRNQRRLDCLESDISTLTTKIDEVCVLLTQLIKSKEVV